jgi:hypothetical protein
MPAELTAPAVPSAARRGPVFPQFPTAWRFALRNQARNRLPGLLLGVLVKARSATPTWCSAWPGRPRSPRRAC